MLPVSIQTSKIRTFLDPLWRSPLDELQLITVIIQGVKKVMHCGKALLLQCLITSFICFPVELKFESHFAELCSNKLFQSLQTIADLRALIYWFAI